jgi:hypothetical protein
MNLVNLVDLATATLDFIRALPAMIPPRVAVAVLLSFVGGIAGAAWAQRRAAR